MKNSTKEDRVAGFLGQSFVRIPRKVFTMVFHGKAHEKKVGLVYLTLLSEVYFAEGHVALRKHSYTCKRGEYVGSCRSLSACTGINITTIRRGLQWLEKEGLIKWNPLEDGSRICVCGYNQIMASHVTGKTEGDLSASSFSKMEEEERKMGGRSMQYDFNAGEAERAEE